MISASAAVRVERQAERAGLEAGEFVDAHKFEALAERAAMRLDRLPERRLGRVVDHQHALEIRIIEPRQRVERLDQHRRRLAIGRDVDGDLGRGRVGCKSRRQRRRLQRRDQPSWARAESDNRDLLDARERDDDERDQQQRTEPKRE